MEVVPEAGVAFPRSISDVIPIFSTLFAAHIDAYTLYDTQRRPLALNGSAERVRTILSWDDVLHGDKPAAAFAQAVLGVPQAFEASLPSNEGPLDIQVVFSPIVIADQVIGVLETARDHRPMLAHTAHGGSDPRIVTSEILYDRMGQLLQSARRNSRSFALHLITAAADHNDQALVAEIQQTMAQRLLSLIRASDTLARIDRAFVLIQPEIANVSVARQMILRLEGELCKPIAYKGRLRQPIIQTGLAMGTRSAVSPEEILFEADMDLARSRGRRILTDLRPFENG